MPLIKMTLATAILFSVISLGAANVMLAEEDDTGIRIPNFAELKDEEANAAGMEILKKHRDNINELIRQVDDPDLTPNQKDWPIFILGQLRSSEAVPTLIKHIDLELTKIDSKKLSRYPGGKHPATAALINIGRPASRQIVVDIPNEPGEWRRTLMILVVVGVEGGDNAVFMLENRLEQVDTDQQKERLREAIEMLNERLH